jgi:O-antigen ligase
MKIAELSKVFWDKLLNLLVVFLLAWISFFPQPVTDTYWLVTRLLPWVLLLLLVFSKKYKNSLFQLSDWPLWLVLVCLLSGLATATDKAVAFKTYFYLASNLFMLFYIGKALFSSQEDRKLVSCVLSMCGMVVVLIGFLQFFFPEQVYYKLFLCDIHYDPHYLRLQSTQYNPIVLGSYLLSVLPFLLYFFVSVPPRRRIFGFSCFLAAVIVTLLTISRGALLGATVISSTWLLIKKKIKAFALLIFTVFILVSAFSCVNWDASDCHGVKRMFTISRGDFTRLERIEMSSRIFKDHPFFGIGLNHFRIKFDEYYIGPYKWQYNYRIPDNMYLCLLSEAGLLGLAGFFIFIVVLYRRGLKRLRCAKDGNTELALLVSLSALSGLLANAAVYELFYWNTPFMMFCLICGFTQGAAQDAC